MKIMIVKSILIIGIAISSGCVENGQAVTWRRDVAPITKRIKALVGCTNMLWHGEIITNDSFMSPPGPSAYRVGCFVPNASKVMPSLSKNIKPVIEEKSEHASLLPVETAMLKSEYGIDANHDTKLLSKQLGNEIIQLPYRGQCIFFSEKDVLFVVLYGE